MIVVLGKMMKVINNMTTQLKPSGLKTIAPKEAVKKLMRMTAFRTNITHEFVEEEIRLFLYNGGKIKHLPPTVCENPIRWDIIDVVN